MPSLFLRRACDRDRLPAGRIYAILDAEEAGRADPSRTKPCRCPTFLTARSRWPWEPERADNVHRLNMGVFPRGATIIPNPYNKIPGFSCTGSGQGAVHFVPGFPVMAWPMIEWVLEQHYAQWFARQQRREQSVIVFGAIEAALTPLMEQIEAAHPEVKVFSLPSVDHPEWGRHVELGVKGQTAAAAAAYADLLAGLHAVGAKLGPELVRE